MITLRKLLWLLLLAAPPTWAQTTRTLAAGQLGVSCNAVTVATANNPGTVGGCTAFSLLTSGGTLPNVYTWSVVTTGSPTGISVSLMGSLDGVNWTSLQTATTATTQTISPGAAYRWLGCIPTTFTGGTVTCQISVTTAAGGGGGGGLPGSGSNPFLATSTLQLPNGTATAPALTGGTGSGVGIFFSPNNSNEILFPVSGAGTVPYGIRAFGGFTIASDWVVSWVPTVGDVSGVSTSDTSINRCSAGILCIGTSNVSNDPAGRIKTAAHIFVDQILPAPVVGASQLAADSNGVLNYSQNGGAFAPLGGGGGATCGSPTCTVSSAGVGNGVLALSGNTSGTATLTAPAVAGTSTNAVVFSNVSNGPAGTAALPTWGFSSTAAEGIFDDGASLGLNSPNHFNIRHGGSIFWQLNGTDGSIRFTLGKGQHYDTQAANNDAAGVCSGTTTTCSVTFTTNYGSTPSCVATPTTAGVTSFIITSQAVSGFTITYAPTGTTNFNYVCLGDPN